MKLRTQCHEAHGYPVFYTASRVAIERDAAYAHALVRSLAESRSTLIRDGRSIEEWVEARADELMAEWGWQEE